MKTVERIAALLQRGDLMKDVFIPDSALMVVNKSIKPDTGKIVVAV